MGITLPSRRWPLFLSIPTFGFFSFIVVFSFSLAFLNIVFPGLGNSLPTEAGDLSMSQGNFFLALSAGLSAAQVGMLSWGFLVVRSWRWLQMQHWSMAALFGGLIGLIEIICISCLMWVIFIFFLFFLIPYSINDIIHILLILPLTSIAFGIFTLIILAVTTKGLVFLGGIAVGMGFALLARRVFG